MAATKTIKPPFQTDPEKPKPAPDGPGFDGTPEMQQKRAFVNPNARADGSIGDLFPVIYKDARTMAIVNRQNRIMHALMHIAQALDTITDGTGVQDAVAADLFERMKIYDDHNRLE